jgi:hypothetical protein
MGSVSKSASRPGVVNIGSEFLYRRGLAKGLVAANGLFGEEERRAGAADESY